MSTFEDTAERPAHTAHRKKELSNSKARKKRPTKAEQRAETTELILDEAEYLFSLHGLHGVTLKDVAKRVGVHHTLLNYYFEDKQKLFEAVFGRRAVVANEVRMKALDEYERATNGQPTVEGALHAFLDTNLDLYGEGGDQWRYSGRLAALVSNTPEWGAEMFDDWFDPLVRRLIDILKKALPEASEEDLYWGYHFTTGALMLSLARTGRIDKLSGGLAQSEDFGAIKQRMARFMAAGIREICVSPEALEAEHEEERAPGAG